MLSLVITGNPGVGKHTIGKHIAKTLDLNLIDLNQIAIDEGIFEEKNESKDVDVSKLKKILKLKLEKNSLVVGHLAPYVLTKSQVKKLIILRKNPYKLKSVYKQRKYSKNKIKENLESEILGIIAHDSIKKIGKMRIIQIDTTGKSIQKVVLQTKNAINGKKKSDGVDWLSLVSEKNDLKKFFSYD